MALFRATIGGGIPQQLQQGMDTVLNKKWGTATSYPPADWPDTVNLMGPLVIKTASGAVATFDDGANDVPVESGIFTFEPKQAGTGTPSPSNPRSISGWTGLTVSHGGKNLCNFTSDVRSDNRGLYFTANADGSIRYYGTTTATYSYITNTIPCDLRAGATYTFSRDTARSHRMFLNCTAEDGTSANYIIPSNSTSVTFTPTKNIISFRLELASLTNGGTYDITVYPMVEAGETTTTFRKYKTIETIQVSWQTEAGTIYAGYYNSKTGILTATHIIATFDGSSDEEWTYNSTSAVFYVNISEDYKKESSLIDHICNIFDPVGQVSSVSGMGTNRPDMSITFSSGPNNRIYLKCSTYTSTEDFKTFLSNNNIQITIPLATPVEYQLDPEEIRSYLGDNSVWHDAEGETEINYRADTELALAQASASTRSLSAIRSAPAEESQEEPSGENQEEEER